MSADFSGAYHMRKLAAIVLAFCLAVASAPAGAQSDEIMQSAGLVCDTAAQIERFVAVLADDRDAAIAAVNREAGDPAACGIVAVAFIRGADVKTVEHRGRFFVIAEIAIVGVITPGGPRMVSPPLRQFTLFRASDRGA
jgi:hypothetical protein